MLSAASAQVLPIRKPHLLMGSRESTGLGGFKRVDNWAKSCRHAEGGHGGVRWYFQYPRGALEWRMHRWARVILTINFHLGTWTPQQCVQFLNEIVGCELDNSTAEVGRSFDGSAGPLYESAYLMGGLQFRAVHYELVDSAKMTHRELYHAILHQNSMPIELLRADLEHQPLSRDFVTGWKLSWDHPVHP